MTATTTSAGHCAPTSAPHEREEFGIERWRPESDRSLGHRRSRNGRRALVAQLSVILLASTLPTLTPAGAALGADPRELGPGEARPVSTGLTDPGPIARSVTPVDLAAQQRGDGAGATGSSADPSIGLRPTAPASAAPTRPTELVDARTETTRVTANADGTVTLEASSGRLHYRDDAGTWQPIDLTLVPEMSDRYAVRTAANDRTVRLGTADGRTAAAELTGGGTTVRLRLPDAAAGTLVDDRAAFAGPGLEQLWVRSTSEGFEYGVTLDGPVADPTYRFILDVGSASVRVVEGGIALERVVDLPGGRPRTELLGLVSAAQLLEPGATSAPDPWRITTELISPADEDPDAAGLAPTEILLRYRIDREWLADPERTFPVVIDPTACIRVGSSSGCDINDSGGDYLDHYLASGAGTYVIPSTWIRVGRADYANPSFLDMRGLVYFDNVALPDGALVTAATMELRQDRNQDSANNALYARALAEGWGTTTAWSDQPATLGSAYDSPTVNTCGTGDTNCSVFFDVERAVRAWYTRRGTDWKPNLGFQVRMATEGSTSLEAMFYRSNVATVTMRPLLSITYEIPKVGIDFDDALGPAYAPSAMVAGEDTRLPVRVANGSGFSFADPTWKVGYRWFDQRGGVIGSGLALLGATVVSGTTGAPFALAVAAPATPGAYTLRLDLVRVDGSTNLWASDWAKPTLYYSRNKKLLATDSTRWTGTSVVERDEFAIDVVAGGGQGDEVVAATTGDGSTIAIDLASRNLRYEGADDLGFADRIPIDLAYGYDARHAASTDVSCSVGVLRACGWWTTYDERLVPSPAAVDDATYQAADGSRYHVDGDSSGQFVSAAPVRIDRPRVTFIDENGSGDGDADGAPDVPALTPSFGAYSGTTAIRVPSGSSTWVPGMPRVNLNRHRNVAFAVRTDGATSTAIDFKIHDRTTGTDFWFAYTVGPDFTTGLDQVALGGTIANTWATYARDLYADVYLLHGGAYDDYEVTAFQTTAKSGSTGWTYLDAIRFEPEQSIKLSEAAPSWTAGSSNVTTTADAAVGSVAFRVTTSTWTGAPRCESDACFTSGGQNLESHPFLRFRWKAAGADTVAIGVEVRDVRTGAESWLTYYAGPYPPADAPLCPGTTTPCVLRVRQSAPFGWEVVTRTVADDARQLLGYFNDDPSGTLGAPPTQGPTPDNVRMTGYRLLGVGNGYALFDDLANQTAPVLGEQLGAIAGDDFMVTHLDRERHFFGRDGLLTRIVDRDDQTVRLEWTYDVATAGPAAYALSAVHAPTDGLSGGTYTYQRRLGVGATETSSARTVTLIEKLGSTGTGGTPISGRSTQFTIALQADPAGTAHGIRDLISVNPARRTAACAASEPTGCVRFGYTDETNHRLDAVYDPRYDGAGGIDLRWTVAWSGADPIAIRNEEGAGTAGAYVAYVFDFDRDPAALYRRVVFQDGAARSAEATRQFDLAPDGPGLFGYAPKACASADCSVAGNRVAATIDDRISASEFDGLTRVVRRTTWRCTVADGDDCAGIDAAQRVVSRRSTNAGAKVDNFVDPLAAAEVAWTQSPDQQLASLRDSGGSNPDLYRTGYRYDAEHRVIETRRPAFDRLAVYGAAVKATNGLDGHWRFDETTGSTAADASGGGHPGTISGASKGQTSGLVRDAGRSFNFDGTNDVVTIASSFTTASSFTVEAWVKPTSATTTMAFVGSRKGTTGTTDYTFDAKLCVDPTACAGTPQLRIDVGNGSTWLWIGNFPFTWTNGRWYHIAIAVDSARDEITAYVDGEPIGRAAFTTAGTALLADATRVLRWGNNGRDSTSPEWWSGGIDEPAVYGEVLNLTRIRAHWLAGRGSVDDVRLQTYDAEGHPRVGTQTALVNGGFEDSRDGWRLTGTSATIYAATSDTDANVRTGYGSLTLTDTGEARQDLSLLAGQTVRLQVATKSTSSAGANVQAYYWSTSAAAWATLLSVTTFTNTSWSLHAWDLTLPFNTDGRIRIYLHVNGDAGTVRYDDIVAFTDYTETTYVGSGPADGLPQYTKVADPASVTGTLDTRADDDATTERPGIFASRLVANYLDGSYDDAVRDADLVTTRSFDAWGRVLSVTDPDGVTTTTTYVASGEGTQTDVASVADGLGNTTSYDYDAVGNPISASDPLGNETTSAYDTFGHPTRTTLPDGTDRLDAWTAYGVQSASYANETTGTPAATNSIDVKTSFSHDPSGNLTATIADDGTFTDAIRAKTETASADHDRLGNPVRRTAYAAYNATSGLWTGPRTTTDHFETATVDSITYSRPSASGTQLPIAPTAAPAPLCPGSVTVRCNSAAVWTINLTATSGVDQDGVAYALTDAYGVTTLTDRDLAGRTVRTIAGFAAGGTVDADTNLATVTTHDIRGLPVTVTEPSGLATTSAYDAVGRPTIATYPDGSFRRTVYLPSGRVEGASRRGAAGTSDSNLAWTATVYDAAGRAVRTLDHVRLDGTAGLSLETFEDGDLAAWSTDAGKAFINGGATLTNSGCATCLMHTGTRAGYLVTDGAVASEGAVFEVSAAQTAGLPGDAAYDRGVGSVFRAGQTYQVALWARSGVSGETVDLQTYLGSSGTSGDYGSVTTTGLSTAWTKIAFAWTNTTGADQSTVYFAIRNQDATARTIRFDNVTVWAAADPARNAPVAETVYDAAGRPIESIVPPTVAGDAPMVTRTTYDPLGRVTAVSVNHITQSGGGAPTDGVTSLTTATTYDDLGRPTSATDPAGVETRHEYDRLGRLTATIANYVDGVPTDGATVDDDARSTFAYDTLGELTGYCSAEQVQSAGCLASNDASPYAWHVAYDALGRRISETPPVRTGSPALNVTRWTYEPGGRLTYRCSTSAASCTTGSANLRRAAYAYDDLGRVLGETVASGSPITSRSTTTNTYGTSGTSIGRLTIVAFDGSAARNETAGAALNEGIDTITLSYVPSGNGVGELDIVSNGSGIVTDYAYDGAGQITSRADGTSATQTFAYDWADRPIGITSTAYSGTLAYAYGLDGLLTSRTLPGSGGTDSLAYDAARRPVGITRSTGAVSLARTYDRRANVTSESRSFGGLPTSDATTNSQTFSYDALGRVTASTGLASATFAYQYDLDGNRTRSVRSGSSPLTQDVTYDRTDQLLTLARNGGAALSFAYDVVGDLVTKQEPDGTSSGLQYDTAGHLVKIDRPGTSADPTYGVDALGRARSRTISGAVETYGYLGLSDTVVQVKPSGTATEGIIGPSGERLALRVGATLEWTLFDAHGDLAGLLDPAGTVVHADRYDPYGEVLATYAAPGALSSPWRYQGALDRNDGASALYTIGARDYAPSIGAWTSLDSFAGSPVDPASMNRFLYAEANPTSLIDPTGHRTVNEYGDVCNACLPAGDLGGQAPPPTSGAIIRIDPNPPVHRRTPAPAISPIQVRDADLRYDTDWSSLWATRDQYATWNDFFEASGPLAMSYLNLGWGDVDDQQAIFMTANAWHLYTLGSELDVGSYYSLDYLQAGQAASGHEVVGWFAISMVALVGSRDAPAAVTRLGGPPVPTGGGIGAGPRSANTVAQLRAAATAAAGRVGAGRGPIHGTYVHTAFRGEVAALGRGDLATEVSYLGGSVVPYGTKGSVRLDVVEGSLLMPTAIYDLKTGGAGLSPARIARIRANLPAGSSGVPILEIRP